MGRQEIHHQMKFGVILLSCGIIVFYILFGREDPSSAVKSWKDVHVTDVFPPAKTGLVSCNDPRLMPPDTFPPIALASFPGSGNTWLRHLIEAATGCATGSVYESRILSSSGFIGEREPAMSGKVLTIKTHKLKPLMVGAILLVRNPYRAMVAEYNRRNADKTGHAAVKKFKTLEWRKYVKYMAGRWMKLNTNYISSCNHPGNICKSILIVYYERLQEQPVNELRRILEFLPVSIDEERFACAIANSEGAFHRPKRNWTLDPFSREDRILVDRSVKTFFDLLQEEGLKAPPPSTTSYPNDF